VIERNGKQLLSLINDILDISRIESGQVEVECTKFNLNLVISELVNMIEPLANGKNIQLIFNKGKNALYLNSDEIKCRHILQNLIANAVKFTEKGSVEITARQKENSLEVLVKDTGIGISEDQIHHIFDEFRQADGSTSRKFGGTGLGLAIAKKYASLLGGTIAVYSVQGSGSEFVLKLPKPKEAENLHPKNNAVHKNKKRFPKIQTNKVPGVLGKTILLIEDSEVGVIQMEDVLAETGYETIVARNGSEALKIVDQFIPDSIVLDLMMPEIDGFEVLKSLRDVEKTAHIPVLILTAKAISKEELKFLKRNKIHQLIQKGDVKREQLLNAVNTMIFPLGRNNVNN